MKLRSIGALAAAGLFAGGLMTTSAQAADLGGDCCADLEERISELEQTTARKGNRKVSLTITGFVAQQVMFWDDGFERNTYITDTGSVSIGSHFALTGSAKIAPGLTAGYKIKIEVMTADSLLVSQNTDDGVLGGGVANSILNGTGASSVALENSYWFLKSDRLGELSVGQQSSAVDNQAIIVDGSGSLVQANYVLYDVNFFFLRRTDGALTGVSWGNTANCHPLNGYGGVNADCDGVPHNNVKYTTPTVGGLSASFSYGEDDIWGVSGRFARTLGSVKFSSAIAYSRSTDENGTGLATNLGALANGGLDVGNLQIGAYGEHVPTGLFLYGAWGTEYLDTTASARGAGRTNPEGDQYYIKAGLKRQLHPVGMTTFFGYWGKNEDRFTAGMYDAGVNSSELTQYGLGVVQNIDPAAMSIWLAWKHYDVDINCADADAVVVGGCGSLGLDDGDTAFEDFDIIKAGALIAF